MRPTWLERKRGLLLSQGLIHLCVQPLIFFGCPIVLGPATSAWGPAFNFSIAMMGGVLVALAVVGYRRHRLRMRAVMLYLLTTGLEEHGIYGLYMEGIIDYKTLKSLVPENVIVTPSSWRIWA